MFFFSFTNLEAITRNCYWKYKLILIGNIFDRFKVFLFWAATSSCVQIVMFTDQYDWTRCKSPKMFLFRHMVKKLTKWSKPSKRRQNCHYNTNYTGTSIWYCTQWFASINSSAIRFMGLFAKFRQEETAFPRKFSHPTSELSQ